MQNVWLGDETIIWAQSLLKDTKLNGMQDTLVLMHPEQRRHIKKAKFPSAQIHHLGNHWVATASVRSESFVEVFDSLSGTLYSNDLVEQIKVCYPEKAAREIRIVNVDKQPNLNDCGAYAIAFLVELAAVDSLPLDQVRYDNSRMRLHLRECLATGYMTPFPKISV